MPESKRITHQFLEAVQLSDSRFDRVYIPFLMFLGVLYAGYQAIERDWLELAAFSAAVLAFMLLAVSRRLQRRVLGRRMNRQHATYAAFAWVYLAIGVNVARLLANAEPVGKNSGTFYMLVIALAALVIMFIRALTMLTPRGYRFFSTEIPLWEQVLVACNELIAAGLLAGIVGGSLLPPLLQPDIITARVNPWYTLGVGGILILYYAGMQLMWVQRWNNWLSESEVWLRLARVIAPLTLIVTSMVIARRFSERAEPRSADLLGGAAVDLAVLSLGGVVWLVLLVVTVLVYTSRRGLRQRFLPDLLLDRLPPAINRFLRTISDVDMLLILGLLATFIPLYLFLLDDSGGIIGALSGQILQGGSAFLETGEQALALLFAMPFYVLAAALMALYAYVFSRASVSAAERDELAAALPVSFLIALAITLYLFAVPVSQVLTEQRLPQLQLDLGRILAFNVFIPLVLLYAHYFLLVRWPYGRGQSRWREQQSATLLRQQHETDARIEQLNGDIDALDQAWQHSAIPETDARFDTLFRYVQLNSLRDDLNMQRLQIVTARQQLAELSEAPVSIAVARLPLRVVSFGIPLLITIQLYQWAFVNNGLREIINTPNLTIDEFIRIILQQLNF